MADTTASDPALQASVSDSPQTPKQRNAASDSRPRRGKKQGNAPSNSHPKPRSSANSNLQSTPQSALSAGIEATSFQQQQPQQKYVDDDESEDSSQPNTTTKHKKASGKASKPTHRRGQPSTGLPMVDGTVSPRPQTASGSQAPNYSANNATPVKQAYAGPTFHASPAPSALPMPKFLSRSVPQAAAPSSLQEQLEHDDEEEKKENGSGSEEQENANAAEKPAPPPREESPLDFFFNAHRAEQARQRSGNTPTHLASRSQSSLTPESADQQYYHSAPRPNSSSHRGIHRPSGRASGRDIFMMELDGTGETDASDDSNVPAVPFKERIHAARNSSSLAQSQTQTPPDAHDSGHDEAWRVQQSQALKRLLMAQQQDGSSFAVNAPGPRQSTSPAAAAAAAAARDAAVPQSATQRSSSMPGAPPSSEPAQSSSSPSTASQHQSSKVKDMESNLRRMLKLDP